MKRLYESPEIADAYMKYRSFHSPTLTEKVIQYCQPAKKDDYKKLDLVVDVGCGPGNSTRPFQPHFHNIIGIDISFEQLKQAKKQNVFDNVTFEKGSAENIPVADGSVDLLVSGVAAHWFDLPKFYGEVKRVLKPDGCIALWSYIFPKIYLASKDDHALALKSGKLLIEMFTNSVPDNPMFNDKASLSTYQCYRDIFESIPFENKLFDDDIHDLIECSSNEIEGFVRSFSYYETFMQSKINEKRNLSEAVTQEYLESIDLASAFTRQLKELWNIVDLSDDAKAFQIHVQYFLLIARLNHTLNE